MPHKTSSFNFYSPKDVELKEKVEHQERLIQELQAQNTRMEVQNAKIMELMSKFTHSDVGLVNMNDDSP